MRQTVIFILASIFTLTGSQRHCYNCDQREAPGDCEDIATCSAGEQCITDRFISESGHAFYRLGCRPGRICQILNNLGAHGKREITEITRDKRRLIHLCTKCCDNDYCNRQLCLTATATVAPTTRNQCYKCNDLIGPIQCETTTLCEPDEVCFLQEMKYTISIPSLPRTYYHGGCIKISECPKVSHTSVVDEHGLATVVQGECCSSLVCNRQLMKKYEARGMCEVCQGPNCGPGSGTLSLCPVDSPLCMTTVVNDQHGHKDYIKRCASESECDQKWLGESSLKSECMGFKKDNSYLFDFTCHYCCKTKDCDKDIVPNKDTMYTGTN